LYKNINQTIPRVQETSVVQVLDDAFSRVDPNKTALKFENDAITYGQLISATNNLAVSIQSTRSVNSSAKIGLLCKRGINAVLSILGILKSGSAYVPIDIEYPKERVAFLIKDASLEFILVDDLGMNILKDLGMEIMAKPIDSCISLEHDFNRRSLGDMKDQTAYLIYTSGSTGVPKGVEISHRNVVSLLNWAKKEFHSTPFEILYSPTSYCFDLSVFEYLFPLVQGKTVRILEDVLSMHEFLKSEQGIFINTVPSVVKVLLETEADFSNVTSINMAGEAIPGWVKEALDYDRIEVRNLYGPSEDTTYSTCYRFKSDSHSIPPIGKPIIGTHLFMVDADGHLVPEGVEGEICLAGESVSKGYLNRPDLTKRFFVENTYTGGGYLYKTGDIGKILSDGEIGFVGRRDNQIKLRGFRIELGEIKSCLEFLNDVQQAEILVLNDQLVVVWTGAQSDSNVLQGELSRKLPAHSVPAFWQRIEKFPTNLNGKLDLNKLQKIVLDSFQDSVEYEAPSTDLEEKMVEIWQTVLGRERIGVHDDFFRLGGHSLLALQVRHLVEAKLHYELTVEEIFSTPTIANLVQLLYAKPLLKVNSIPALAMDQDERDPFWESIKSHVHVPLDAVLLGYSTVGMNCHQVELNRASIELLEQISKVLNVELDTVLIAVLQRVLWTMARVEFIGARVRDAVLNRHVGTLYQFEANAGIKEQLKTVIDQTSNFVDLAQKDKLGIDTNLLNDLSIRYIDRPSQEIDARENKTFLSFTINGEEEKTVCIKMRGGVDIERIVKLLNDEIIKSINGIADELQTVLKLREDVIKTWSKENSNAPAATSSEALDFNFNF
jgi:amino acid adenylation domain-containing protein